MTIKKLYTIIRSRQKSRKKGSYIASLFEEGKDRIIQKIGEETMEVVIAAKNGKRQKIVSEVADLWFHTLILLAANNISPEDVFSEFDRRNK